MLGADPAPLSAPLDMRDLRPTAVPLLLGAVGLLAAGIPSPTFVALAGLFLYGAAVALQPWAIGPLVLLSAPFHLRPRPIGGLDVSAAEMAVLVGTLAILVHWALDRSRRRQSGLTGLRPSAIDWAAAGLLTGGLLSLLPSEYPKQSLRELRWLLLEPLLLFYLVRATVTRPGQASLTLGALALSGAVASLTANGELLANGSLLAPSARAAAPYLSPNHLGLFLERAGIAGLALALYSPWPLLGWATFFLSGVGILRSVSIGAWIGFGAAVGSLVLPRGRRWLLALIGIAMGGALVAVLLLPPERTIDRFNALTGTGLVRWEVWQASMHMAADHPILGVGLDNFLYLYRGGYMLPDAWREPNLSHPHNWLLQFWLDLGVLGLVAAVGAVIWTAITAHRLFVAPRAPEDRVIAAASGGLLVTFLVHGFVDNSYFLPDLALVWWVVLALLANARAKGQHRAPSTASSGGLLRGEAPQHL